MRFQSIEEISRFHNDTQTRIKSGDIWLGRRHYALSLLYGVIQAIHCGMERITAIELGVAKGNGLLDLCRAARYYSEATGIAIDVIGLDNGAGLPAVGDYKDHPEVWRRGQFSMGNQDRLREKLPGFAELIIGDIAQTIHQLPGLLQGPIAFVAVDLDYYSSTKPALDIFRFDASAYVPAVPAYFDDVEGFISNSDWTGEGLAITEFNESSAERKIGRKDFGIRNFYVCHVFDHPIRSGKKAPTFPFEIYAGFVPESTENQREFLVQYLKSQNKKIAIAPAGNHALWLFENSPEMEEIVTCFIDRTASRDKNSFLGRPMIAASEIVHFDFQTLIVASPYNETAILEQLRHSGLKHDIEIISTRQIASYVKSKGFQ